VAVSGLEVGDADRLEACEQFSDAAVGFDPWAVALALFGCESSGDCLAGDFARPLPVGAVGAGWIALAGAARSPAAGVALLD